MPALYSALVHYPIKDRSGNVVTTSVTNLDVHDLSRLSRTYDLAGYFVVTPIEAQRELVGRILSHWSPGGAGAARVPKRAEALSICQTITSLQEASDVIAARHGKRPRWVATSAQLPPRGPALSYEALRRDLLPVSESDAVPLLLIFGTGHGLTDDLLEQCDDVLEPLRGGASYNHLSVRTAAAIILDRLLGERALR